MNTGRASKQDLKSIDRNFQQSLQDGGRKIWQMLEEIRLRVPKTQGKDTIDAVCARWSKWLDELKTAAPFGYCDLKLSQSKIPTALLEASVDADADLFRLLISYDSMVSDFIRRSSYEVPNVKEIAEGVQGILDAYTVRQNLMSRISGE